MALSATAVSWLDGWFGVAPVASGAELVMTADFTLLKKADDSTEHLYASIARPGFTSGPSDTPASTNFLPRLVFPDAVQTLNRNGEPTRNLPLTWGTIGLISPDGYYSGNNPSGTDWLDPELYEWQSVEARIGAANVAYTSFEKVLTLRVAEPPQFNGEMVEITPALGLLDMKRPAYDARYSGFDCQVNSDDGSLYADAGNSDTNIAADEDAYFRIDFTVPAMAADMVLHATRNALASSAAAGMTTYLNSSGNLIVRLADGTTEVQIRDNGTWDDGARHTVQWWLNRATGVLSGEVDGTAFDTLNDEDASALGAVTNTVAARLWALTGGGSALTGALDEYVFKTGHALTDAADFADLRKQHQDSPASIREVGAQYVTHFDEDDGTKAESGLEPKSLTQLEVPKGRALEGTAATREVDYGDNHDADSAATDYTIWCWFRTAVDHTAVLVGKKDSTTAGVPGWMLRVVSGGSLNVRYSDTGTQANATGTATFQDGVWRCAAFVLDYSGARGEANRLICLLSDSSATKWDQVASVDISGVTATDTTASGVSCLQGESGLGTANFDGDLGAWGFASEALTNSRLAEVCSRHPTQANLSSLVAYYAFDATDEASPSTVVDQVGSADGTIGAGATWVNRDITITPGTATNGGWESTLTSRYAGEGAAGRSRVQPYGKCETYEPPLLDDRGHDYTSVDALLTDAWVFDLYDGPDSIESVELVTEGGVVATEGTDYVIDLTNGWMYYDVSGGTPSTVRVTVKGAKFNSGAYSDKRGLILREILTTNGHLTTSEIPAAAATDLDAKRPQPVGILIPGGLEDPKPIGDVLADALGPDMYPATDLEGDTLGFGVSLVDPYDYAAKFHLTDKYVLRGGIRTIEQSKPIRKVSVGYARQWDSPGDGGFLGAAQQGTRERFRGEWHYAVATSSSIAAADGREVVYTSALQDHDDALVLAQSILQLLDGSFAVEVEIVRYWWQAALIDEGQTRPDCFTLRLDSRDFTSLALARQFVLSGSRYVPPTSTSPPKIVLEGWTVHPANVLHDDDGAILTDDDDIPLKE